jgi:transcriptional regulator with XRE-family HTH domain
MDLADLDRLLGIDPDDPIATRSRRLVEADTRLLDELVHLRSKVKKLSQDEVAKRMGISQSAVARIESGDRDPRLSTLRRYALAVGAIVTHAVEEDSVAPIKTPQAGRHLEMEWPSVERTVPGRAPEVHA